MDLPAPEKKVGIVNTLYTFVSMKGEKLVIRVTKEFKQRIETAAKGERRTTGDFVRLLVEDELNRRAAAIEEFKCAGVTILKGTE